MKRIRTKKGDIFEVRIDEGTKKYFQYIENDMLQLNSDVIRAFKTIYPVASKPDLLQIVNDEIDFVVHTMVNLGIKMSLWTAVGNVKFNDKINTIFRDTNDYGSKPGEQIKISKKWYIWRIGDADFTDVGELKGENRKSEIGVVMNPVDIVHKMQTGEYHFVYPGFE